MDRIGPYELQDVIGQGASGTVWRALTAGPAARTVAIKRARLESDARALTRCRDEVAVLASLDHPHIVRVLDVIDDHGTPAIVMPLAEGGSLADLEARCGALSPGEVVAVLAPIADALASAHRRGIVHGDVKPSNILLTRDGDPLLADFGEADRLGRPAWSDSIGATPAYCDPRRIETGRPVPGDDVYALALVAGEALTGSLGVDALADRLDRLDPEGAAGRVGAVVRRVLDRSADQAELTAAGLATALRAAVPAEAVTGPLLSPARPTAARARSHPAAARPGTGTERFGPRPPVAPPPSRSHRSVAIGALGSLAVLALLVAVPRLTARPGPARPSAAAPTCATAPRLPVPPGATEMWADLSGHGCRVPVVWSRGVAELRLSARDRQVRRYVFRPAGGTRLTDGTLLAGDWDCDGVDGLAYYDPGTGLVHYFDRIPEHGALVADAEASLGRRAARVQVARHGRCDHVVAASTSSAGGRASHPAG